MKVRESTRRHKRPLQLLTGVAAGDVAAGVWYASFMHIPVTSGICYAIGVTTTSGSSVVFGTAGEARLITVLMQLLLIPLIGAVFSLASSAIAAHLTTTRVKAEVSAQLDDHHKSIHEKLDTVITACAVPPDSRGAVT